VLARDRLDPLATAAASLFLLAPLWTGCGAPLPDPPPNAPNVLFVVWDTARADRMSLYGHPRPTTPKLAEWAEGGRVYEDALSVAGYTLPSHASMFTGLLPSEHCTYNGSPRLEDEYATLAETFRAAGYRTFLFSANPQVSANPDRNFTQGFERAEHPWSPRWKERALEIVKTKLTPEDHSNDLREKIAAAGRGERELSPWNIKTAGELAEEALLDWLKDIGPKRPWFAFVNYMEAHQPLIPPRRYRELFMNEEEVARSYQVDRTWLSMWEYTFGLRDLSPEELELTRATYDASLRQLDDLFASLLAGLEEAGELDDTIVVLTSDHGEHLGEQHMLDHQYSVYQALLRVPLVLHNPKRVPAGRDARPAANFDVFPTLLALVGIEPPEGRRPSRARDLLGEPAERMRFAEDPGASHLGLAQVHRAHPTWSPTAWNRRLRALVDGAHKLIWGSDGRVELYDLDSDPFETQNLAQRDAAAVQRMNERLAGYYAGLAHCEPQAVTDLPAVTSPEERRMLEMLGYLDPEDSGGDTQ